MDFSALVEPVHFRYIKTKNVTTRNNTVESDKK